MLKFDAVALRGFFIKGLLFFRNPLCGIKV